MTATRMSGILAASSIASVAALGAWGWSADPGRPERWAALVLALPVLWALLETARGRGDHGREGASITRLHRYVIAGTGLVLSVKLGSELAFSAGLVDDGWRPASMRLVGVMIGAGLATWGNYLPKVLSPWRFEDEPFDWQGVHRFAGWAAFLAGASIVVVWLALPVEDAKPLAASLSVTFVALAVGRKLLSLLTHRAPAPYLG